MQQIRRRIAGARGKLLLGFCLVVAIASRVPSTAAQATLEPNTLAAAGSRCLFAKFGCSTIERRIVLRSEEPLQKLRFIATDLQQEGGTAFFSGDRITARDLPEAIAANEARTAIVSFHLRSGNSGEFRGNLLLVHAEGELLLPAIVRIRDPWLYPFVLLLVGVALGYSVATYRGVLKTQDEIVARVGYLRAQVESDRELVSTFRNHINRWLLAAEDAIAERNWEDARAALAKGREIWHKWRGDRGGWQQQLNARKTLLKAIKESEIAHSPFGRETIARLEQLHLEAPNCEGVRSLHQKLVEIRDRVYRYREGNHLLKQCDRHVRDGSAVASDKQCNDVRELKDRLDGLWDASDEDFKDWQQEARSLLANVREDDGQPESSLDSGTNPTDPSIDSALVIPPVYAIAGVRVRRARQRLWWFEMVGHAIAVSLLFATGFVKLYASNPIFGSNSTADYLALLAWGFGAEVTRDAIAEALRDSRSNGDGEAEENLSQS